MTALIRIGAWFALLQLAACGFRLAGSDPLPGIMARPYLSLQDPYTDFSREFEHQLKGAGASLQSSREGATASVEVIAANGGNDSGQSATPLAATAKSAFESMSDKVTATDASTKVTATVAMTKKDWGTSGVVELKNVKGPLKCSLIAVGKNGERETMASWSVPAWGYGIANATKAEAKNPLYAQGGAAFTPNEIDHFEVMTFDGKKLVAVDA